MTRLLLLPLLLALPALAAGHDHDRYPEDAPPPPPPARPAPAPIYRPAPPPPPPAPPPAHRASFHVPPDRVPQRGLCRIWLDGLPPDRQPDEMTCRHAHRTARENGGRVIWAIPRSFQTGEVASTDYGPLDFQGVPPDRLPPPGLCRVWLDGVPPDRQPGPVPCRRARHQQQRLGGRILFMPASDLR